jgi:hypothetical protein
MIINHLKTLSRGSSRNILHFSRCPNEAFSARDWKRSLVRIPLHITSIFGLLLLLLLLLLFLFLLILRRYSSLYTLASNTIVSILDVFWLLPAYFFKSWLRYWLLCLIFVAFRSNFRYVQLKAHISEWADFLPKTVQCSYSVNSNEQSLLRSW